MKITCYDGCWDQRNVCFLSNTFFKYFLSELQILEPHASRIFGILTIFEILKEDIWCNMDNMTDNIYVMYPYLFKVSYEISFYLKNNIKKK